MRKLIIATRNQGKMRDFKALFDTYNIPVISLADLKEPVKDIEESGETFEENAALKAEAVCRQFNIPVIADDSGIEIDALSGAPGIYSARYAGPEKDDQANTEKVLREMKNIPEDKRTARFVCVLAIAQPGKKTIFKRGECEGSIAYKSRGNNGFGYDPIFYPLGYTKTMGELTLDEKNSISHRKKALDKIEEWVQSL